MSNATATPKATYDQVMAAIAEGAEVTARDLTAATEYAKRSKRRKPSGAIVKVRKTKNAGVSCHCGKPAVAKGMCMTDYIREYRKDPANKERANEASRRYNAKKRAAKA